MGRLVAPVVQRVRRVPEGASRSCRQTPRLVATGCIWRAAQAQDGALRPDQAAYRAIYKELVETNTTLSAGSCTLAAERMAAHLRAAGYPESALHLVVEADHPREGNLVAELTGSDSSLKPMLLLAHIDVVEANRADWERDPFVLTEENGYFYARGAADDKSQAAIWVDMLARFRREGYTPARTIRMALTCGEETAGAFNGAEYLVNQRRELIDAEFALNEGANGLLEGTTINVVCVRGYGYEGLEEERKIALLLENMN